MIKIVYLYCEVMGYTMATINKLVSENSEIHLVHWDHGKLTPYRFEENNSVTCYPRSLMNYSSIMELINRVEPELIVVSGWQDRVYLRVCKSLIDLEYKVICCFDDQWEGKSKQIIASFFAKIGLVRHFYTHAWVTGNRQYEYARHFGFPKNRIIFDLYSADLTLFDKIFQNSKKEKKAKYPHNFLFVGRIEKIKGLELLREVWQGLSQERRGWTCTIVGNGSLKNDFLNTPGFKVIDFQQPEKLSKIIQNSGCFILPSFFEPWGVVVHEQAASGLPLLLSDAVGASDTFLIDSMNGYSFQNRNAMSLRSKMIRIIDTSDQELYKMSEVSNHLSKRITPETSANNLLSLCGD
tara:strand:+ start:3536 stop:4591 length:1056 start_codon:yes stop_codon:yes gene_type:complete